MGWHLEEGVENSHLEPKAECKPSKIKVMGIFNVKSPSPHQLYVFPPTRLYHLNLQKQWHQLRAKLCDAWDNSTYKVEKSNYTGDSEKNIIMLYIQWNHTQCEYEDAIHAFVTYPDCVWWSLLHMYALNVLHVCRHMCMESKCWHWVSSSHFSPYLLSGFLTWTKSLPFQLVCLCCLLLSMLCLLLECLDYSWVGLGCRAHLVFKWMLKIGILVLMFLWKVLYPLSLLHNPPVVFNSKSVRGTILFYHLL